MKVNTPTRAGFPGGKRFAFTIFDDTDVATLKYIQPIYALLDKLGFRTTKSVWTLPCPGPSDYRGSETLADPGYANYMRELQQLGFEIAFHGAKMESSERAEIVAAFETYRKLIGSYPTAYAAHGHNRDNLYWGTERFRFRLWRWLYGSLIGRNEHVGEGHRHGSPFYWGDLAETHLRYVRSFTYDDLNVWNITTAVPYCTAGTHGVRAFFPSAFADNVEDFIELLGPANQERLERERGLAIVGTHFGKGFIRDGDVHPGVVEALTRLSRRPGWFQPVSTVLDHLVSANGGITRIGGYELFRLEGLWFWHRVRTSRKQRSYAMTESPYLQEVSTRQANTSL